jgi:hypothetical protein
MRGQLRSQVRRAVWQFPREKLTKPPGHPILLLGNPTGNNTCAKMLIAILFIGLPNWEHL